LFFIKISAAHLMLCCGKGYLVQKICG